MRRRFISSGKEYLTILALEDNTCIEVKDPTFGDLFYMIEGEGWIQVSNNPTLYINKGNTIKFKGNIYKVESYDKLTFLVTKPFELHGDCTSILKDRKLVPYAFTYMFYNQPVTYISPNFLPSIDLEESCYYSMFQNCTSLTNAPDLPATKLVSSCYRYMFDGCSKLNYIKMLATDISASNCLYYWVSGVASTGTFVKNPAMTTLPTGNKGIPSGWTVYNDGEENSGGNNEITFYIDDQAADVIPMKALPNMTWEEFVNSEYANQNSMFTNFRLTDMGAYKAIKFYYEPAMDNLTLYNNVSNYSTVMHYDIIENGKIYYAYF